MRKIAVLKKIQYPELYWINTKRYSATVKTNRPMNTIFKKHWVVCHRAPDPQPPGPVDLRLLETAKVFHLKSDRNEKLTSTQQYAHTRYRSDRHAEFKLILQEKCPDMSPKLDNKDDFSTNITVPMSGCDQFIFTKMISQLTSQFPCQAAISLYLPK